MIQPIECMVHGHGAFIFAREVFPNSHPPPQINRARRRLQQPLLVSHTHPSPVDQSPLLELVSIITRCYPPEPLSPTTRRAGAWPAAGSRRTPPGARGRTYWRARVGGWMYMVRRRRRFFFHSGTFLEQRYWPRPTLPLYLKQKDDRRSPPHQTDAIPQSNLTGTSPSPTNSHARTHLSRCACISALRPTNSPCTSRARRRLIYIIRRGWW